MSSASGENPKTDFKQISQKVQTKPITVLKQLNLKNNESYSTECLLCTETYSLPCDLDNFLAHLLLQHSLVIADVNCIADFRGYVDYWRPRLKSVPITDICSTMHAAVKEAGARPHVEGSQKEFYLLSDILPEDKVLRQGLQSKRLEWVLKQQEIERVDENFIHGCVFCRCELTGTRAEYLDHLSKNHNLQLGRPHNLVFIDELVETIEEYFNKLQCLYCEKFFKDRLVLREHMRKKMHKRINPHNHNFDKYYIVNYLEMGKDWTEVQRDFEEIEPTAGHTSDSEATEDDTADWNDWNEQDGICILCLFCETKSQSWDDILQHLKDSHNFDFLQTVASLDFYHKIKFVNYIRQQMNINHCVTCEFTAANRDELNEHMNKEGHIFLPEKKLWDQPEYYFSTNDDDGFLCQLDDAPDDTEGTPECVSCEDLDPQLCQSLTESHISEVQELKAALANSRYL